MSPLFLYQDLDTPYGGSSELPNPEGKRTLQRSLLLRGEVGLGERLAFRGLMPYREIETSGGFNFEGDGPGDLEAELLWRLGPEEGKGGGAIGGGFALPTGEDAPTSLIGDNVFFGVGATSLLATLEGFRRVSKSVTLFGTARYRLPLASGDEAYRFGDDLGYAGTVAWTPGASRFGLTAGLSGQHLGQDEQAGVKLDNRGGRFHYASLGANVRLRPGLTLGVVSSWLVDQDVRGEQLLAERQGTVGLSWSWGEHEHGAEHDHP